ncbi:T9SS sorting signal type C domain-containing protein [Flavobacterium myungsuense]
MRRGVNNSNQFFRTSNKTTIDDSGYKLNLTRKDGFFSQMLVKYSSDYTLGVDRGIDGSNINSEEYMCSSIDGVAYAIQGRPEFTLTDIVPLQYKVATAAEYSISIEQFDGLFGTQDVYIKDKLTNFIHNLKTGPYTFVSEPGTFTDRFEVVYENPLSTSDTKFNQNSVLVYKQSQEVVINTGTVQMSNVKIYDIRGRLLVSKSNINASQVKMYAGSTQQVLIVKITSDTNGVVTKKVIN